MGVVKFFKKMKRKIYSCSICGLKYKEKKWAKGCKEWCKKYKSCNLEIIKHSISYGNNYSKN